MASQRDTPKRLRHAEIDDVHPRHIAVKIRVLAQMAGFYGKFPRNMPRLKCCLDGAMFAAQNHTGSSNSTTRVGRDLYT